MNRVGQLLVVFVIASLPLVQPVCAQTILKWNLKEGQKLRYVVHIKTNSRVQGLDQEINQSATMQINWLVTGITESVFDISQTISRIQFQMDGPMGKTVYDSKSDKIQRGIAAETVEKMFGSMTQGNWSLKLSK